MLELIGLTWDAPDGRRILDDITLSFPSSGITIITGPNGGGKTTLLKIVMDIEHPLKGKVLFDGEDITSLDTTERAKRGISYGFQTPVRFKGITIHDLLEIASEKSLEKEDVNRLLAKVGLCGKDYAEREVDQTLSGGEIKRIEIASVLARESRIAIFDEPEAGIDIWSFSGLISVFEELKKGDVPVLIVSHQERLMEIADRIIVIEGGRVSMDGKSEDVLKKLLPSACPLKKNGERV